MNDTHLAQSLHVIPLRQTELARRLTRSSPNGKVTTPSVVSRWVNGRSPIPAAVDLYVHKLLVDKLRSQPPALGGPKIVFVGGAKGGSGATTICQFLTVAAIGMGYRACVGAVPLNLDFMAHHAREFLGPFDEVFSVDLHDLRATSERMRKRKTDILFVDIGSKTMLSDQAVARMDLPRVDLFVLPFDPSIRLDVEPPLMAAQALRSSAISRFVMQPFVGRTSVRLMSLYGREKEIEALNEFESHISEHVIIKRDHVELPRGWASARRGHGFQDEDLEAEYASVLHEILIRLGVESDRLDISTRDLEALNFDELLALFGPYGSRTPGSGSSGASACDPFDIGRLIATRKG
jgi:hypothetical protein